MLSFLISVTVFVVLGFALGVWRHVTKKRFQLQRVQLDEQIAEVAEVAQRRHKQRFGRASTDLNASFTITQKS